MELTSQPSAEAGIGANSMISSWCNIDNVGGYDIHTKITVVTDRRMSPLPVEDMVNFRLRHQMRIEEAIAFNPPNCTIH
jgi:hypothetical protein